MRTFPSDPFMAHREQLIMACAAGKTPVLWRLPKSQIREFREFELSRRGDFGPGGLMGNSLLGVRFEEVADDQPTRLVCAEDDPD